VQDGEVAVAERHPLAAAAAEVRGFARTHHPGQSLPDLLVVGYPVVVLEHLVSLAHDPVDALDQCGVRLVSGERDRQRALAQFAVAAVVVGVGVGFTASDTSESRQPFSRRNCRYAVVGASATPGSTETAGQSWCGLPFGSLLAGFWLY
jgi:hypothetical protein